MKVCSKLYSKLCRPSGGVNWNYSKNFKIAF